MTLSKWPSKWMLRNKGDASSRPEAEVGWIGVIGYQNTFLFRSLIKGFGFSLKVKKS